MGKPFIFGIHHGEEHLDDVLAVLLPTVSSASNVGIEVEPETLALFEDVYNQPIAREEQKKRVIASMAGSLRSQYERFMQNPKREYYWRDGTGFFYEVFCAVKGKRAVCFGIDESARHAEATSTELPYLSEIVWNPVAERYTGRSDLFSDGPGYDLFVAREIERLELTHAVIGIAHAWGTAQLTDSILVTVGGMDPDRLDYLAGLYKDFFEWFKSLEKEGGGTP